ncbi:unnamed protein product, partial [marine sediment metagenome]
MKTLIEIHVLQSFAPSNLNRDDTGAPKDAIFGGTRRARVSSQCLKRAVRRHFREKAEWKEIFSDNLGLRSKRLLDEVSALLVKQGQDPGEARERARLAMLAGAGAWVSPTEPDSEQDEKSEYLMFLGRNEIAAVAATIKER